jgi:hypothetical protein
MAKFTKEMFERHEAAKRKRLQEGGGAPPTSTKPTPPLCVGPACIQPIHEMAPGPNYTHPIQSVRRPLKGGGPPGPVAKRD